MPRKFDKILYRLDEVKLLILIGLGHYGRKKSISQILNDNGIRLTNEEQIDAAASLEALDLITQVSYQLPLSIRAELSPIGQAIVDAMKVDQKPKKKKAPKKKSSGLGMGIYTRLLSPG